MNPKVNRNDFLQKVWVPYPAAGKNWTDVADFLRSRGESSQSYPEARQLVCGRVEQIDAQGLVLRSGGLSLSAAWSQKVMWLGTHLRDNSFHPDILRAGDLVGVRFLGSPSSAAVVFEATEILLVAPFAGVQIPDLEARFSIPRSMDWADFLNAVREFFRRRDFTEASTPTLVPSPGTEPYLDPFSTTWTYGRREATFYLPTSPEFHLKKMLAAGWTRIFETKTCFRNGEIGTHHQPEFLMLEWYRAYEGLDAIADDVEDLLRALAARFPAAPGLGPDGLELERTTMAELFRSAFPGFTLVPSSGVEDLRILAQNEGIAFSPSDGFDDLFFRIFLERIEPGLGQRRPILVRGYPPSQAALSRIGSDGFADRFEVYWKGLELANAFHELNDPIENERRFRADAERKKEIGKEPVPVDEDLVQALHAAMPPSGGIAMGLDRLFMALFGIDEIQAARAFPVRDPAIMSRG
jgi:elongation factor P--(R)-beta-lysine ligase